jgi:hypothetical protein
VESILRRLDGYSAADLYESNKGIQKLVAGFLLKREDRSQKDLYIQLIDYSGLPLVPELDTIYIDKPIQRHNLIQTISRVNRKFAGKHKGLVVVRDHLDLLGKLFHRFDASPCFSGEPLAQLNTLNQAAEFAQVKN